MHSFSVCDFFYSFSTIVLPFYCANFLKTTGKVCFDLPRSHDQLVTPLSMQMFRDLGKIHVVKVI